MLKWYSIMLLGAVVGGWFAYPFAYPALMEAAARGGIPEIDWSQFKPGSLLSSGEDTDGGSDEKSSAERVAAGDFRFRAVVMIEGSDHPATGCIIKKDDVFYIVTSQHALAGNRKLKITDSSGREFRGKRMLAAKTADVALIEIDSPPDGLAAMSVAEDVARVAKVDDKVLIPGDGKGLGVLEVGVGQLTAIESVILSANFDMRPALRGAPIFHSPTRSVIGIIAEATESSMPGNVKGVRGRGSNSRPLKVAIRYFGHRLDTIKQWDALDWSRFQLTTTAIVEAREELEMVSRFVEGFAGYGELEELKEAELRATEVLANPRLSQNDRQRAVGELLRIARSIVSRRMAPLLKPGLYYIHLEDVKELKALADKINAEIIRTESNIDDFGRQRGFNI
ncbi:MAG: trypsin-like peptidase domain-containing protein [Verrucomicrobiae bacterium]|nr:trypsin-like peptidase domain-containing protein [Verrucomicrobiae bacterium]